MDGLSHKVTDTDLERAYHLSGLGQSLRTDAVLKITRPKILGRLNGTISPLSSSGGHVALIGRLFDQLKQAGINTDAFDPNQFFYLEANRLKENPARFTTASYRK